MVRVVRAIMLDPPTIILKCHVRELKARLAATRLRRNMASGGHTPLTAIVIGGTGATGNCLVGYLLKAKVCNS